jgi:drug/metabolite transporter (DMT)-like permease
MPTAAVALSKERLTVCVVLAMLAFAGNSLLCRLALRDTAIDPATFTTLRLLSGAVVLSAIVGWRGGSRVGGDWSSAFALFVYAAGFSFAYESLSAGVGALLLFGAVQATMIGSGLAKGDRFRRLQWLGFLLALAGLVGLLLPGGSAPHLWSAALMLSAGVAWGMYSLRGRGGGDAIAATAGNFVRAMLFALVLSATTFAQASFDLAGAGYALASGALTSGVGYVIWYTALPALRAMTAATLQLSVPAIAAFGGVVLLGEALSLRLVLATIAILGGVALTIWRRESDSDAGT